MHVAKKDIPQGSGLKPAPEGINNTVVIDVKINEMLGLFEKLDIISSIKIFENLSIRKVRDFMDAGQQEFYKAGENVNTIINDLINLDRS